MDRNNIHAMNAGFFDEMTKLGYANIIKGVITTLGPVVAEKMAEKTMERAAQRDPSMKAQGTGATGTNMGTMNTRIQPNPAGVFKSTDTV
jgi:hypothetical protein